MKSLILVIGTFALLVGCGKSNDSIDGNFALVTASSGKETLLAVANRAPTEGEMSQFIQGADWQPAEEVLNDQNGQYPFQFEQVDPGQSAKGGDACPEGTTFINGGCYIVKRQSGEVTRQTVQAQAPAQISAPVLRYNGQNTSVTKRNGTTSQQVVEDQYYQDQYTHQIQPVIRRIQLPDRHEFVVTAPVYQDIDLRGTNPAMISYPNYRPLTVPTGPLVQVQSCATMTTTSNCTYGVQVQPTVTTTTVQQTYTPQFVEPQSMCNFTVLY